MDGSGLLIRATVLSGSTCVAVFGPGYAAGILHFVGGEVRLRAIGKKPKETRKTIKGGR